jgi:hypothetical protein
MVKGKRMGEIKNSGKGQTGETWNKIAHEVCIHPCLKPNNFFAIFIIRNKNSTYIYAYTV